MSASKLFHTIVVMGVGAAAACGGRAAHPDAEGSSGSGPVDPTLSLGGFAGVEDPEGVFWPSRCESRYQYVCDSYAPLAGCRCDTSKPRTDADCGGAPKISCSRTLCAPDETCYMLPNQYIDCHCVPDAPSSPADCAGPGQFACAVASELRDCSCDPTRPGTPADCMKPEDFTCDRLAEFGVEPYAQCRCAPGRPEAECLMAGCPYECQSDAPRFGCECKCPSIR